MRRSLSIQHCIYIMLLKGIAALYACIYQVYKKYIY